MISNKGSTNEILHLVVECKKENGTHIHKNIQIQMRHDGSV